MNKIRLRFAPSPTGFLHIGGLRTALFDYLIAKSLGGILFLRIEDTDQKREVAGAVDKLIEILDWTGIKFDEGPGSIRGATNKNKDVGKYGPYIQSQRLDIYKKYVQELLDKGEAYPCFCTEERLAQMRADLEAKKMPPRYDRACRNLSPKEASKRIAAGEKYVIRHKLPLAGEITVADELRGELKFKYEDLDDYVLIKSDGVPTYQFASVVDDHLMKTSHVVRGDEWLPSLPKNISLYKSFGWEAPKFIHLPLVLDKKGGKLSKRKGDVAVEDFRAKGYLPEALLNFNALLGWSPCAKSADKASGKSNSEVFSLEKMIKVFDYKNIGTSPAIFNTEKLDYLNGLYIRKKTLPELITLCRPYLAENIALTNNDYKKSDEFIGKVVSLERERLKMLSEIGPHTKFFFIDNLEYDPALLVWKKSTPKATKKNLSGLLDFLEKTEAGDWQAKKLEELVTAWLKSNNLGIGDYLWPMRAALTGEKASPSPFEMADALGKTETLDKIKKAIEKL